MAMMDKSRTIMQIVENKEINVDGETLNISNILTRENKKSIEYRANDIENIIINCNNNPICKIEILGCDSPDIQTEGLKTAILNFASSKNPGGGFLRGANAQEESLCYRSNLYSVLERHMPFYEFNREHLNYGMYSDGIIYSEDIAFLKDRKLQNIKPYTLDVITCAAPNFGAAIRKGVRPEVVNKVMYRRIEQIIKAAIDNKVEHLVLGAFGCGVFKNNPEIVANYMKDLIINKEFGKYFKKISFAMHDDISTNSMTFRKIFS